MPPWRCLGSRAGFAWEDSAGQGPWKLVCDVGIHGSGFVRVGLESWVYTDLSLLPKSLAALQNACRYTHQTRSHYPHRILPEAHDILQSPAKVIYPISTHTRLPMNNVLLDPHIVLTLADIPPLVWHQRNSHPQRPCLINNLIYIVKISLHGFRLVRIYQWQISIPVRDH